MRLRFIPCLSIALAMLLPSAALTSVGVSAVDTAADNQEHATVITVHASEIKAKGAFKAIQPALNSARYCATKDNVYKIVVEPGEYVLRSALHLYSNTTLSLTNVTLKRDSESITNMIRTGDDTACDKGETGYSSNSNITVENGTLDGGATTNTMVKVTHAEKFKMVGTVLKNLKNAHMMEIAAVDGFEVKNCSFQDQVLEKDAVGAEAIQLDIPKSGHLFGCRSEALAIKNVRIEGCYFTNLPRGVGSHTQILNVPYENIKILNNTFRNLTSVAIQGENWKDVTIAGNRIENTPRAIAMYSILGNGTDSYKPSVLAKEGKTSTTASDSFQKPYNANILISNNAISGCGGKKEVYSDYDPLAILVSGKELTKAWKTGSDGCGGYPKGNYYVTGISIVKNNIDTAGHGIYLNDVRNIRVNENTIKCAKSSAVKGKTNPITSVDTIFSEIKGNNITSSPYHGMEIAESSVNNISDNSISNVALDGIILEAKAKVKNAVSGNYITKASGYGVDIRPYCAGGKIYDNIIYNCSKGAIQQEKKSTATVGSNYFEIAEMTSMKLNKTKLTLGNDEKYRLSVSYTPVNAISKFSWNSSNEAVAGVNQEGIVTAHRSGEADITVKSAKGKTAVCHLTVMPAPKSVKLNATMLTIGVGETFDLDSTLSEGSVSHTTYTSNNPGAVAVNAADGVITGKSRGTATIVVKTHNGKHACCNVIVKEAPYDMWFDKQSLSLGVGEISTLSLSLPDGSASNSIVYQSDNPNVLTVEQNGELLAKSLGDATVTATAFNGAKAICRIQVLNEPDAIAFENSSYEVFTDEIVRLYTNVPEGTASNALSFQSSDPDICRIDKTSGEITAKKPGKVIVTVKTYNRISATCTVVVR